MTLLGTGAVSTIVSGILLIIFALIVLNGERMNNKIGVEYSTYTTVFCVVEIFVGAAAVAFGIHYFN